MVTMITEMAGSPMSGRSATRSIVIPSTMEKARVIRNATGTGRPIWAMSPYETYAPRRSISPCARLSTSVALYMRTKPSAMSA